MTSSDATPPQRVGFADRDAAVDALQRHHADGRLDTAEFEERMDAALRARTQPELADLFRDLPDLDGADPGVALPAPAAAPVTTTASSAEPGWAAALRIAPMVMVPMGILSLLLWGRFDLFLIMIFTAPALTSIAEHLRKRHNQSVAQQRRKELP